MLATLLAAGTAAAAPLDGLLTAVPERRAAQGLVEAGASVVNRRIDFSTDDPDPALARPDAEGDYRDAYLSAAWQVRDGWWLGGTLARRTISAEADRFRYLGWQLWGQTRLLEAAPGGTPALALRLSAWGNRASATETTSPVRVPGAVLDSVEIRSPADRQWQADLIATWALQPALDLSVSVGAGRTRLSYGGLSATTTRNGCLYDLSFSGNDIFGSLAEPCDAQGGVIEQFFDRSGEYGVDVAREIAWDGSFAQVGANLSWRSGPWTLSGGLLFHTVRRDAVDDILAGRGDPVHRRNRILTLEAGYHVTERLSVLARAQLASRLFFNDLPVTYNSVTSGRFGSRLSLFTIGLRQDF